MRKVKFVSAFTLLALLLSISQTVGLAQAPQQVSPSPTLLDLDGPVSKWTDADLECLVDLIVEERITIQESQIVAEQLTQEQLKRVGELLAAKSGVLVEEWLQDVAGSRKKETDQSFSTSSRDFFGGGQPIEYKEMQGSLHANSYYSSTECSGDDDWVFHWPYIYYGQDPDGLRWWTTSSRVYWAYLVSYGLKLNGFGNSFTEVRLCAGKTSTSLAGGPDWVRDHIYVKHQ